MRILKEIAILAAVACGVFSALRAQQSDTFAWSPLPVQPNTWVAPNQPIWKLSDLLAKRKGQTSWSQTVVDDATLHADYVSMAPGAKTPRQFHPDTRAWWIVQDGQIRFSIEGQEPFVASKGYLVQVPYRNVFSMETVGDKPSLRLEVNIAGAKTMYPIDEKPAAMPGFNFVKVRISGKGKYDQGNKPYIDFNQVVAGRKSNAASSLTTAPWRTSSSATRRSRGPRPTPIGAISTWNRRSSGSSCWARWNTRSDRCPSSSRTRAISCIRLGKPGIARDSAAPKWPAVWR